MSKLSEFLRFEKKKLVLPIILLVWFGATVGVLASFGYALDRFGCNMTQDIFDSAKASTYENITVSSEEMNAILDQKYNGLGSRLVAWQREIDTTRISYPFATIIVSLETLGVDLKFSGPDNPQLNWISESTSSCVQMLGCAIATFLHDYSQIAKNALELQQFKAVHPVGKNLESECNLILYSESIQQGRSPLPQYEPVGISLLIGYTVYLFVLGYVVSSAIFRLFDWSRERKVLKYIRGVRRSRGR